MCSSDLTREKLLLDRRNSGLNRIRQSDLAAGLRAMYPTAVVRSARTEVECVRALEELGAVQGPAALVLDVASGEVPPFLPFLDLIQRRKNR